MYCFNEVVLMNSSKNQHRLRRKTREYNQTLRYGYNIIRDRKVDDNIFLVQVPSKMRSLT